MSELIEQKLEKIPVVRQLVRFTKEIKFKSLIDVTL